MHELPSLSTAKQVVIFHTGALGDLLLSRPELLRLRRATAEAVWEAVGYPERLELLRHELHLRQLYHIDAAWVTRYRSGMRDSLVAPRNLLDPKTLVVSFIDGIPPQGAVNPRLRLRVTPPDGYAAHVTAFLRQQAVELGASQHLPQGGIPELLPSAAAWTQAASWLQQQQLGGPAAAPLVAIHPGSGSVRKCWPIDRFVGVARWLRKHWRASIIVVRGPAEQEWASGKFEQLDRLGVVTLDAAVLDVLAAVLRRCYLYLGNDSGVTHLAAAVGCPSVAIFGVTDWRLWAPLGDHVRVHAPASPPPTPWRSLSHAEAETAMRAVSLSQVCETLDSFDLPALARDCERRSRQFPA